ncbi:unconventional myosin-IXb-like isoform X2 [Glandiceps talaboti]
MDRYNSMDGTMYLVRVYPGSCAPDTIFSAVEATKNTRTSELIEKVVRKLNLDNVKEYYLSEVCQESGQNCIERKLEDNEYPVRVQLLWPKSPEQAPGDPTYVPTKYHFFLRSVHQENANQTSAFNRVTSLDTFMNGFLPKLDQREYDDLCNLPDLSEDTLMNSIISRFKSGKIYTYVGSILISVNPFKFFPIYNPKYVNMYQNRRLGELPPHIFAVADAAFHTMLSKKSNQCVVISGESGSGKTEATNLLLHHLTALSQKGHASGLEQTILGAGPVLEAFGNAMTVVNNNSSRFGKFIQVNYKENGTAHGAIVENYLLEKSRIVHLNENERNYHVFYYLLAGASNAEKEALWLGKPEDYHYLNQSKTYTLEGVDEVYEFSRLKQSMEMVGFSRETMRRIFLVLSALLHLGNVEFRRKSEKDEGVTVKNVGLVKVISDLLKVKQETLLAALTTRKSVARGDTFVVQYKPNEAIHNRDALAKCLYSALFDWIVLQVNHALMSRYEMKSDNNVHGNSIGVLDIFGFEDFGQNSFEQFCINFANEHLQYYFNQHVFKLEQEEYEKEGIQWDHIDFVDNTSCLNLLSKRPTGLFQLLDDDCNFPQLDHDGHNLVAKFDGSHHNHECFELPQVKEASFTIVHYAGKIKYQAREFRDKNNDMMRPDVVVVLKNSNMTFVRELIGADPVAVFRWGIVRAFFRCFQAFIAGGKEFRKRGGKARPQRPTNKRLVTKEGVVFGDLFRVAQCYILLRQIKKNKSFKPSSGPVKGLKDLKSVKKLAHRSLHNIRYSTKKVQTTVGSQFQISLSKLMEALNQANPFFVRCIKSNSEKEPCRMDQDLLMRQLRYTGMLETVRIRRAGYNVRWTFEEFCQQYKFLLPSEFEISREKIEEFLINMDLNKEHYQIGETKVFLRESERIKLQEMLHQEVLRRIHIIQRWIKTILAKRRYQQTIEATVKIQASVRMFLAKRELYILKERDLAACAIQSTWKAYKQRILYMKLYRGVVWFQSIYRGKQGRLLYQKLLKERKERIEEEERRRKEEEERLRKEEEERLREEERRKKEEEERLQREEEEERLKKEQELLKQLEEGHSSLSDEGILMRDSSRDLEELEELDKEDGHMSDESSGVIEMGSSESEGILLDDEDSTPTETGSGDKKLQTPDLPTVPFNSPTGSEPLISSTPERKDEGTTREVKIIDKSGDKVSSPEVEMRPSTKSAENRKSKTSSLLVIRHLEDSDSDDRPLSGSIKVSELAKAYQQEVAVKTSSPSRVEPRPDKVRQVTTKLSFREIRDPLKKIAVPLSPSKNIPEEPKQDERELSEEEIIKDNNVQPAEPQKSRPFWRKRNKRNKKLKDSDANSGQAGKQKKKGSVKREDFSQTSIGRTLPVSFNVTSTSQWRYPSKQLISDVNELQQMDDFLLSKVNEVNQYGGRRDTIVDIVFKKAMQEYRRTLISTYSVAMQDGQPICLMYKDLISNFEKVLEHISRKENTSAQFPIIMGVNAFRGYLDEFIQIYKPSEQQVKKQPKKKKKPKDEVAIDHLGHKFVTMVFNIPTACEHCSAFLWLMEKGLVCSDCKFTCHKKCYNKYLVQCSGTVGGNSHHVFGGKIDTLVKEDVKVPPIVEKCISIMEMKGLYTEGIYRKAGSAVKVRELKAQINNKPDLQGINFDDYNVFVIGQVLKSFFREMQQPLLTFELYDEMLRGIEFTDHRERVQSLFEVIDKLPRANHDLFERLIFHLARVALNESSNKMSANGLAIVFSPCLMKTDKELPPLESLQHVAKQAVCLECIITENMKKITSTLADIRTLESAANTASKRRSTIVSSKTQHLDLSSDNLNTLESTDEEELQMISEHLKTLQEEKENLTARLPELQLRHRASETSDDDRISSDDLESLDNLDIRTHNEEYAVTFDLPPAPLQLQHLNKKRVRPQRGRRLPSRYSQRLDNVKIGRIKPGNMSPALARKYGKIVAEGRADNPGQVQSKDNKERDSQKQDESQITNSKSNISASNNAEQLSGLLRDIDKVLQGSKSAGPTFV